MSEVGFDAAGIGMACFAGHDKDVLVTVRKRFLTSGSVADALSCVALTSTLEDFLNLPCRCVWLRCLSRKVAL